ncbi:hypothetical protein L6452_19123 [Arctium lappa]|uniref:Uncharacterized protein n=1 Tax=Arctium lappa TaxID=4217 RepID=A0ACB9B707_ARCLA|nr:hypothetical protein L6452_19123 [Arctium lappa]
MVGEGKVGMWGCGIYGVLLEGYCEDMRRCEVPRPKMRTVVMHGDGNETRPIGEPGVPAPAGTGIPRKTGDRGSGIGDGDGDPRKLKTGDGDGDGDGFGLGMGMVEEVSKGEEQIVGVGIIWEMLWVIWGTVVGPRILGLKWASWATVGGTTIPSRITTWLVVGGATVLGVMVGGRLMIAGVGR